MYQNTSLRCNQYRMLKQKTKLSTSSDQREYHLENKHGGAHGEELENLIIKVWFIVIVL